MNVAQADAFWAKVDKGSDCWLWLGSRNLQGYGRFWSDGKARAAHRVSYELNVGPIPARQFICHSCDNPGCVRPDHLFVGSAKDNTRDCIDKGRFPRRRNAARISDTPLRSGLCRKGHPSNSQNTLVRPDGRQECRLCRNAAERARYANRNPRTVGTPAPRG